MKTLILTVLFGALMMMPTPQITWGAVLNTSSANVPEKIVIMVGDYQEEVPDNIINQWVDNHPRLVYDRQFRSEIENYYYCPSEKIPCALIFSSIDSLHVHKTEEIIIDSANIESFLNDLSRRVNKDPVNAKFQIENERVTEFSSSQEGVLLDLTASSEILKKIAYDRSFGQALPLKIVLPYQKIEPEIKNNNDNELGINELIGEGSSNFSGSPKNRVFNIRVASDRFNGVLIKPGEEFSFVSILGPVDGEHGYLPELVIKKDKTEPEFGGGICQVSTTAFRAAIYSGLKITARRNHAYPVRYYNPQGMDATVYVPRPDLRFINNTPGYILIQTKIEGTELKFQFYGTNDGRKTELDGPTITERNPDGSMKATFTQKVFDKDSNQFIKDVFNSNYDSPNKYPHPGQEPKITEKPKNWSEREWKEYKKANGL